MSPRSSLRHRRWDGRRRRLVLASTVALLQIALAGCAPPPSPRSAPQVRHKTSKEALFGDPSLVPTRAGERARVEIALARTIEEHLAEDPEISAVRAHVASADGKGEGPAQIVISLQGPRGGALEQEERAREVALAILGDREAKVTIDRIEAPRGAQEPPSAQVRPLSVILALALLALGASAAISVDRLRRRRSRV